MFDVDAMSMTGYPLPPRSKAANDKASSSGTYLLDMRTMPDRSPSALAMQRPKTMAVSSTVWCDPVSISPVAVTARSIRACLARA